ncbi:hypothetical protein JCM18549_19060 [Halolamina salina]
MTDDLAYPATDTVLGLHEQIVADGEITEPGVRSAASVGSAVQYVSEGFFGEVPESIHEKAVQLMRLLVAEHPFVDGNKRTALRTVVVFYALNGSAFEYGHEIRALLHRFAADDGDVDADTAVVYFRRCARWSDGTAEGARGATPPGDDSATVDEELRRLSERYRSAESDEERREIALEIGEIDGRRHAGIYEALEDE